MDYRAATASDAEAIAALHADSWRRHYRGVYSNAFLDHDVVAERLTAWTDRFGRDPSDQCTIVAECDGVIVGFVHVILDDDPTWGALLDNLHVARELQGQGVGTRLMAEAANALVERRPSVGMYLWVLEQNEAAQRFYEARGGECVDREVSEPPGGGSVVGLRYVWRDPAVLMART